MLIVLPYVPVAVPQRSCALVIVPSESVIVADTETVVVLTISAEGVSTIFDIAGGMLDPPEYPVHMKLSTMILSVEPGVTNRMRIFVLALFIVPLKVFHALTLSRVVLLTADIKVQFVPVSVEYSRLYAGDGLASHRLISTLKVETPPAAMVILQSAAALVNLHAYVPRAPAYPS